MLGEKYIIDFFYIVSLIFILNGQGRDFLNVRYIDLRSSCIVFGLNLVVLFYTLRRWCNAPLVVFSALGRKVIKS